jgi:hypothetical protein
MAISTPHWRVFDDIKRDIVKYLWLSVEERDRELLEATYQYTVTTDSDYVDTGKFVESEYGKKFAGSKLLNDLEFLFQEGHVENSNGIEYVAKQFRISPNIFEACASQFEPDFEEIQKKAIKAMVEYGDGITFDELAKKIGKPPVWTLLLMRLFDYRGWMRWDFKDGKSMHTVITPRGKREAE